MEDTPKWHQILIAYKEQDKRPVKDFGIVIPKKESSDTKEY